jgi:hypothetical protein
MDTTLLPLAAGTYPIASGEGHASSHLQESRERVVEAVRGLTETQWRFKPAPERWSIAEIVEHLALVEDLLLEWIIRLLCAGPERAIYRNPQGPDAWRLMPVCRWTPAESLDRFIASRDMTSSFFDAPETELRQLELDHPALGPVDGYQWVAFIAAHTTGLVKHILGVKAQWGFPG